MRARPHPPHRRREVLCAAHDAEVSRLGGFLTNASAAMPQQSRSGLVWCLAPGALVAAERVGWCATPRQEQVMVVLVLPGMMSLADAVGTQTETVVVCGSNRATTVLPLVCT